MKQDRAIVGRAELLTVAAIAIFALALRLWRLDELPPGLHVDEAHNGMDALQILEGWRPLYLPGNNGREVLYSYVQALTIAFGGPTIEALRAASAILGAAAVVAAWAVARQLAPFRPAMVGLATAWLSATTLWSLHFGRLGIRGVTMPLLGALAAAALWRAYSSGARRWWIACGVLWAVGLYAHPAARLAWLAPAGFVALALARRRRLAGGALDRGDGDDGVQCGGAGGGPDAGVAAAGAAGGSGATPITLPRGAAWALLAALLVAAPLIVWARAHPELFLGHAVEVSVLDPEVGGESPLRRVVINVWRTVRAIAWRGTGSWYHNVSDRPVYDPVTASLFLVGLVTWSLAALRRFGRLFPSAARTGGQETAIDRPVALGLVFTCWWMLVGVLPTVLTSGAPNASRAVAAMPAVFLPTAVGATYLSVTAGKWWCLRRRTIEGKWRDSSNQLAGAQSNSAKRSRIGRPERYVETVVIVLLLAPSLLFTWHDYFGHYANAAEPRLVFGEAAVEKARLLWDGIDADDGAAIEILPSSILTRRAVLRYLTHAMDLRAIDLAKGLVVPPDGLVRYAFDGDEESAEAAAFAARWPSAAGPEPWRDDEGRPRWLLFGPPATPQLSAGDAPLAVSTGGVDGNVDAPRTAGRAPLGGAHTAPLDKRLIFGSVVEFVAIAWPGEGPTPSALAAPRTVTVPLTATAGATLPVVMWWRTLGPGPFDATLFVHLVDEQDRSFGQADTPPLGGSWPATSWRAGDLVAMRIELPVADGAPSRLWLRVGWYDPATGTRLSLPDDNDDAAEIAQLQVRAAVR